MMLRKINYLNHCCQFFIINQTACKAETWQREMKTWQREMIGRKNCHISELLEGGEGCGISVKIREKGAMLCKRKRKHKIHVKTKH